MIRALLIEIDQEIESLSEAILAGQLPMEDYIRLCAKLHAYQEVRALAQDISDKMEGSEDD